MRSLNFIISGQFHCHLSDTYQINTTIHHYYRSTYRNSITHIYRCCVTCYFQFNILVRRKSTKKNSLFAFSIITGGFAYTYFFSSFFFSVAVVYYYNSPYLTYIALVWSVLDVGYYIFFRIQSWFLCTNTFRASGRCATKQYHGVRVHTITKSVRKKIKIHWNAVGIEIGSVDGRGAMSPVMKSADWSGFSELLIVVLKKRWFFAKFSMRGFASFSVEEVLDLVFRRKLDRLMNKWIN